MTAMVLQPGRSEGRQRLVSEAHTEEGRGVGGEGVEVRAACQVALTERNTTVVPVSRPVKFAITLSCTEYRACACVHVSVCETHRIGLRHRWVLGSDAYVELELQNFIYQDCSLDMRRTIAPEPTVHWLFRSHDLPSKFSAV